MSKIDSSETKKENGGFIHHHSLIKLNILGRLQIKTRRFSILLRIYCETQTWLFRLCHHHHHHLDFNNAEHVLSRKDKLT